MILQILLLIVRGIIPAGLIYLTKIFVEGLVAAIGAGENPDIIYRLLWIGVFFGVLTVLSEILGGLTQLIQTNHAERLTDHIFSLIHEKSIAVDIAFYEQPDFFDHLHRAQTEAHSRPVELIGQLAGLLQNSVTMLSMGIILLRYGVWLPLILLLSALPTFYVILRSTSEMHRWERSKTSLRRRSYYYDRLLTTAETAAELRLFKLGAYFREKFIETRTGLRKELFQITLRQKILEFIAGISALGLTAGVFIWIIRRTLNGIGTVGDLALFYQIFSQGQVIIRSFLGDIGRLYSNSLFLGNIFEYLDLQPEIVSPINPQNVPEKLKHGISFENVSFSYQGSKINALNNFDLFVPANKTIAVVGENGAGKSTLIKLLCRFYDPEAGAITVDGVSLKDFSPEDIRRMMTVLFQSPVRYNMTVSENIALGNVEKNFDLKDIKTAAEAAGADAIIQKLPQNYQQMLGHLFADGRELSGGEWQRLALARAIIRQAPLILLDEPTSAMDPWAEADWLKRFLKESRGKTVLIITHRFTTAMRADIIYVMHEGKIIESGTHDELLSAGKRYANSWREQIKDLN